MIPKKIHYCWFGGNPLPDSAKKCIASWKKCMPDYEIIEWNESNYDVRKIPYIAQAYDAKKFAFVSDFARVDILNENGGIYFDTDVEVIKDITPIIEEGAFVGLESKGAIATGLGMASNEGDEILKEIIESYKSESFIVTDGSLNLKTVVTRVTEIFIKHGFDINSTNKQSILGYNIFPMEYFSPKDVNTGIITLTDKTYTIHHYDASWLEDWQKTVQINKYKIFHTLGKNIISIGIVFLYHSCMALYKLGLKAGLNYIFSKIR